MTTFLLRMRYVTIQDKGNTEHILFYHFHTHHTSLQIYTFYPTFGRNSVSFRPNLHFLPHIWAKIVCYIKIIVYLCPKIAIYMERLIGRTLECRELQWAMDSQRSKLIILYGRLRVGKTFLVRRFFDDKICLQIFLKKRFHLENTTSKYESKGLVNNCAPEF